MKNNSKTRVFLKSFSISFVILGLIAASLLYAYNQGLSFNFFGNQLDFAKLNKNYKTEAQQICSKFDFTDNFGKYESSTPLRYQETNTKIKDFKTLEMMIIAVSVGGGRSEGNPKYLNLAGLTFTAVMFGGTGNTTDENYKDARISYLGFYNLDYDNLKTLTKKDFLQSLDCSILNIPEEKLAIIKRSKDVRFYDKNVIEYRVKTSLMANDDEIEKLLDERTKDFNDFVGIDRPEGKIFPEFFNFAKMYREIPILIKDIDRIKEIGYKNMKEEIEKELATPR